MTWAIGIAWVVVAHRHAGRIVLTITDAHGVHLWDVLGIAVPATLTRLLDRASTA